MTWLLTTSKIWVSEMLMLTLTGCDALKTGLVFRSQLFISFLQSRCSSVSCIWEELASAASTKGIEPRTMCTYLYSCNIACKTSRIHLQVRAMFNPEYNLYKRYLQTYNKYCIVLNLLFFFMREQSMDVSCITFLCVSIQIDKKSAIISPSITFTLNELTIIPYVATGKYKNRSQRQNGSDLFVIKSLLHGLFEVLKCLLRRHAITQANSPSASCSLLGCDGQRYQQFLPNVIFYKLKVALKISYLMQYKLYQSHCQPAPNITIKHEIEVLLSVVNTKNLITKQRSF